MTIQQRDIDTSFHLHLPWYTRLYFWFPPTRWYSDWQYRRFMRAYGPLIKKALNEEAEKRMLES